MGMVQACGSEDNRKYSVLKLEQHLQYIDKDRGWRMMDVEIYLLEDELDSDSEHSKNKHEGEVESDARSNDYDSDGRLTQSAAASKPLSHQPHSGCEVIFTDIIIRDSSGDLVARY
eukprot:scaffold39032_cov70-Cyclotella_meneghiniana.AAC.3